MFEAELILKTTPPRLPRAALERPRFAELWQRVNERAVLAIVAPAGFGKTTLMLQWRRLWLERGSLVAWATLDAQDEPARLARGLLNAMRSATGRAVFEPLAALCASQPDREVEAMTSMLAEISHIGIETVLMLDDVERLPPSSAHLLAYLMHNAPPNLHLVVGSRVPLAIATAELTAKSNLALMQAADLRLRQDESVEILLRRFGARISLDEAVRVHEATEGWPIGLQLAAATLERSEDLSAAVATLSGRTGDIGEYFMDSLFARLPELVANFLVQTSILDRLSVELCEAVTCCGHSAEYLDQVATQTPFLAAAEHQHWMRLHPLARDFLLHRFEQLSAETREIFHCRAYHYFARSLWTLGTQGRITEARAWLERIPPHLLTEDIELGLIAAWIIASSERNGEALATAKAALYDPKSEPRRRLVAARVAGVAAIYADRLGLVQDILADWPTVADVDPLYVVAEENGRSILALYAGANSEVRERGSRAPSEHSAPSLPFALAFSRTLVALSHLQDGNCFRVEAMLRPLLAEAERSGGRRGTAACSFAAVQAAALRELGQPSAALSVLADRLDAIERTGVPEVVLLAYRTLSNVALDQNDERRALHVLQNLEAFAARREMPRLALHALADAVRIHAQHSRVETAAQLLGKLAALV